MIDILMPRLSDTMTEGAIAAWHKRPGDAVAPGDVLLEIETDKALMEQEAYEAGTLVEILVAEGENVPIGTPIARLDDGVEPPEAPSDPVPAPAPATETAPDAASGRAGDPRRAATPLVRRLAAERGIDLGALAGTGPGGRIVRADLDAAFPGAADAGTAATPVDVPDAEAVPFDAIRRTIAARLAESAATIPVFHATASADVVELLALRTRINDLTPRTGVKVSVNDLVVKAAALALVAHPGINASYAPDGGGQTLLHRRVHVGIAVAAPAGLVVPVVRDADRATVTSLARSAREVAGRAADRTLTASDMSGGTFTVSNLGMYGVEQFTAIINPPQGAILAVGGIRDELALTEDGVVARQRLRVTLTSDHRIIDGAAAGAFLATLTELLEHPLLLIA